MIEPGNTKQIDELIHEMQEDLYDKFVERVNIANRNTAKLLQRYQSLREKVIELTNPIDDMDDAQRKTYQALRNTLPQTDKKEEIVENVKRFNTIFKNNSTLFDPDHYGWKCVGHLVASILTLGIYAGVMAAISYHSNNSCKFWKSPQQIKADEALSVASLSIKLTPGYSLRRRDLCRRK